LDAGRFISTIAYLLSRSLGCKVASPKPPSLVVDALDECNNSGGTTDRLFALWLLTGSRLHSCSSLPQAGERYTNRFLTGNQTIGIILHDDIEQSVVTEDIRKFLCIPKCFCILYPSMLGLFLLPDTSTHTFATIITT